MMVSVSDVPEIVTIRSRPTFSRCRSPGATSALIGLKLSSNAQFADKAGGCRLATQAAKGGDEAAKKYLADCPAN